ncbi:MAG: CheR family methyltransferase, partial [Chloroflexia bacterium]
VIAQHLDPNRPSHLGGILERHTTLPVITVQDHEPLMPNTVYVVPSNVHVEISDHHIELLPDGAGRPKPSVDLLLSSAAKVFGEQLVAVILTGTGSDGTVGARAVKENGGTVVIQNPRTAAYPGMPQSVAPQTVDVVADMERIGPILHDLLTGAGLPEKQPDVEREVRLLLDQLREHRGFDFRAYKLATIQRRLQRRMVATNTRDLAEYKLYLENHPEEYQRLISSFLIKVTEFVRDPDLFNVLREEVVPDLIAHSRKHNNELRIWSAGCATGEEAYSLALILCEALGEDLPNFNIKIFATDLDSDAVEFARRGRYPEAALDKFPDDLKDRYFTRTAGSCEAKKHLRGMIIFGEHDLVQRAPFPRIDMAMCRNVLIYFTKELQQHALELFAFALREGGYLVLGKTETVSPRAEYFTAQQGNQKIYRRREGRRRPVMPINSTSFAPLPAPRGTQRQERIATQELLRMQHEATQIRATRENLLHQLPVGVVVVDRRYDIQEINSAARQLLSIHTQAVGEDLVHLAHYIPQRKLRAVIDQAIKEGTPGKLGEVQVLHAVTGEPVCLEICCYPHPDLEDEDMPYEYALILVTDVTETTLTRRALEQSHEDQLARDAELVRTLADLQSSNSSMATRNDELAQAIADLEGSRLQTEETAARHAERMEHLSQANSELLTANKELTRNNAQLRAMQEEFMSASEETQAAVEEVETLNEEMQASNEELETLNEELQATIEELHTSNADLEARGNELQGLTGSLQTQRELAEREKARLEAILAGLADSVLVVSSDGKTLLTNVAYQRLFGDGDGQNVLTDEGARPLPLDSTPAARAARGETFSMIFTLAKEQGNGVDNLRWFEAVGQPSPGEEGTHWGVVVIRDVTERSLRLLQEQFATLAGHELRTPLTTIQGYLQLLATWLKERPSEDSVRPLRNVNIALSQVQRLTRLINDLVDVSRLQAGKFNLHIEPVELNGLLSQSVEIGKTLTEKQMVSLDMGDEVLVVNGDPERLQQVMLNLMTNAMTHAPGSTRIDVRLRRVEGGDAGDMAEIEVQDYGKGIEAQHLVDIFSRFYQVWHGAPSPGQGLGLGLFIAHQIVTAHGGAISVNSVPDKGATFTVRLPLLEP